MSRGSHGIVRGRTRSHGTPTSRDSKKLSIMSPRRTHGKPSITRAGVAEIIAMIGLALTLWSWVRTLWSWVRALRWAPNCWWRVPPEQTSTTTVQSKRLSEKNNSESNTKASHDQAEFLLSIQCVPSMYSGRIFIGVGSPTHSCNLHRNILQQLYS